MITFRKNIIDDDNYSYGIYLASRPVITYHVSKKIVPLDQVIIRPASRPFKVAINRSNTGLKISFKHRNYDVFYRNPVMQNVTIPHVHSSKTMESKTMYHPNKLIRRTQTDKYYYPSDCFPDRMACWTKNGAHSFTNYYASSPTLHNFYKNLTTKSSNYFWNKIKNHPNKFHENIYELFEKQELLKIAAIINRKIIIKGKKCGINYNPYLIKINKYYAESIQEKISQAENFLKNLENKQSLIANKTIKPSAPSFEEVKQSSNPEIQSYSNNTSSFFHQRYIINPIVDIKNNTVNININKVICNVL